MALLSVVGIGSGDINNMTFRANEVLENADIIVGFSTYIDLIKDRYKSKEFLSTAMTTEVDRCKKAIEFARQGKNVALVSSGDSGIYGMAGLVQELYYDYKENDKNVENIEIEIVPGITALSLAASKLGAPIMHDFAVISLSDLLTPWELIKKRLLYAAKADFVVALYNPKSKKRVEYIKTARDIFLGERNSDTPVGIVRNAYRKNEEIVVTNLENMLEFEMDMFCIVIIGNSNSKIIDNKIVTPRGYKY